MGWRNPFRTGPVRPYKFCAEVGMLACSRMLGMICLYEEIAKGNFSTNSLPTKGAGTYTASLVEGCAMPERCSTSGFCAAEAQNRYPDLA